MGIVLSKESLSKSLLITVVILISNKNSERRCHICFEIDHLSLKLHVQFVQARNVGLHFLL